MEPYILWFGKYRGQAIEQLMFDPAGYAYLVDFILVQIQDKPRLVERVREVIRRGDQPCIVSRCPVCGALATHLVAEGSQREGFHFSREAYCEEHIPSVSWETQVPLRFSSVRQFNSRTDQRLFIAALRAHCGLERTRITAEVACNFFFPD